MRITQFLGSSNQLQSMLAFYNINVKTMNDELEAEKSVHDSILEKSQDIKKKSLRRKNSKKQNLVLLTTNSVYCLICLIGSFFTSCYIQSNFCTGALSK